MVTPINSDNMIVDTQAISFSSESRRVAGSLWHVGHLALFNNGPGRGRDSDCYYDDVCNYNRWEGASIRFEVAVGDRGPSAM